MSIDQGTQIAMHATTTLWQWAVIPSANPQIYIPAPSFDQATAIAKDLTSGLRPEFYCYFPVPDALRQKVDIPPLPTPPDVPRGFGPWQPVSAATADCLVSSPAAMAAVEQDRRIVYFAAAPLGMDVRRLSCRCHREPARPLAA
ncbi:hypothetical protein GV794_19545 [Nocardia cyriacigeorgica]|uniref:Uncharacterized protein n=1 Tax=Nocardia cyriacigeorgica TaxID=135487 RepID=A0A6P1D5I2_9NOCA|nr:hypothetical protein [Nocardia cyriacigeorgica]NEW41404.1 hypothetical protein [Nocardia cyriacigeorgica]NEW44751.1 hypothetical protein [Nocardia cyriacigeorgica]NEW50847.1 hypothetical protein [Nocardia cyriacigeorgica]NEW57833.1 hypothetical protein [Nocardia cyriacigeorgica]